MNKSTILQILAVFLIFLIPRTIDLGSDMANIDTLYWYPRIEKFTDAILKGDLKGTYQQYHPGTTLLWASGTAKYSFEWLFEKKFGFSPEHMPHHFARTQFAATFPLVLMISFLGTLSYIFIKNLSNNKLAWIFVVILSLEPFFLGISKYLHLTALSIMFGFAGFLALLQYLKNRNIWMLIFSGILVGLGLATKISLLSIYPAIGLVSLYYFIVFAKNRSIVRNTFKAILTTASHLLAAVVTFFAISPYMWVAPLWGAHKIYKDGIIDTGFEGGPAGNSLLNNTALYYLETAFLRLTPFIFLAFVIGILIYLIKIRKEYKNVLITSTFILLVTYYLVLSIPSKLKDRYLVELIPMMLVFSAYAIYWLFEKLKNRKIILAIIIVYFAYMSFVFYSYRPAYSFYYTELIGGPKGFYAMGNIPTNRGEWYAQAAQYLNTHEENGKAEEKNIIIGNESLTKTFQPFYYGKTYSEFGEVPDDKPRKIHYLITRNGNQKYVPQDVCPLYKTFGTRGPLAFANIFVFKCADIYKDDLSKLIPTFPDY